LHTCTAFRMLYVVLDRAPLEVAKVSVKGNNLQLVSSDDHQGILRKNNRDLSEFRPDIVHQCLMTLLDSPLNKSGNLRLWIRTGKGVLIEVNPRIRIPRTWNRFAGLMTQLLTKLSIRTAPTAEGVVASAGGEVLMNVIKNPLESHLPQGAIRIGLTEAQVGKAQGRFDEHLKSLPDWYVDKPVIVWIGAVAKGEDVFPEAESKLAISEYALSASVVCGKVCEAMERLYGIF
jgi:rRNA small subunit pseudouridine methyltransferase Nep1